jgi:hypothetical protein
MPVFVVEIATIYRNTFRVYITSCLTTITFLIEGNVDADLER